MVVEDGDGNNPNKLITAGTTDATDATDGHIYLLQRRICKGTMILLQKELTFVGREFTHLLSMGNTNCHSCAQHTINSKSSTKKSSP